MYLCQLLLCSGDQNPLPRRTVELMQRYGEQMAHAIWQALGSARDIQGSATLSCVAVELPLRYHTLPTEEELVRTRDTSDFFAPCMLPTGCTGDGSVLSSLARPDKVSHTHPLHAEWASVMLDLVGQPGGLPEYQPQPFPLSVWEIGDRIRWIAMGGEVTVGYVERFRHEFHCGAPLKGSGSAHHVWVSGYTNQVSDDFQGFEQILICLTPHHCMAVAGAVLHPDAAGDG
jgi:neutral ceramidase